MEEILLIVFGAMGAGFFLIFLLGVAEKKRKASLPATDPEGPTQKEFERNCVELLERMKLNIESIERTDENTLEMKAKNPAPLTGGEFFIYTIYLPVSEHVTAAEIIEVSNVVIQDRLSKGILMTNTRFTDDLPAISELSPMEFIDGARLKTMMANLPMV